LKSPIAARAQKVRKLSTGGPCQLFNFLTFQPRKAPQKAKPRASAQGSLEHLLLWCGAGSNRRHKDFKTKEIKIIKAKTIL